MGLYDTMIDQDREGQVKCFGRHLRSFHPGDLLPPLVSDSPIPSNYSIALPFADGFVNVHDGFFTGITDQPAAATVIDKFADPWTGPDHYTAHRDQFSSAISTELAREGIVY